MRGNKQEKENGIENPDQLFKNDTETKERDIIYPNEQIYIRGFLPTLSIK